MAEDPGDGMTDDEAADAFLNAMGVGGYTLTTADVRRLIEGDGPGYERDQRIEVFDRWLTEHDAELLATVTPNPDDIHGDVAHLYIPDVATIPMPDLHAWLSRIRPNPDDARQVETSGQAVYDALPLHWDVRRRKDARKVSEDIARAVLAALAEAVGRGN